MHEGKLAQYVFELLNEVVKKDSELKGREIKTIVLSQSEPNTVVPDSFEFYFREIVRGTEFADAQIQFENSSEKGLILRSIEVED